MSGPCETAWNRDVFEPNCSNSWQPADINHQFSDPPNSLQNLAEFFSNICYCPFKHVRATLNFGNSFFVPQTACSSTLLLGHVLNVFLCFREWMR